ncbi:hypothetical protein N7475_002430 [Penicillium sp. IBT 31633x]|nr:hypothetical protein N7475_002430 [Penicillium sp. IBT 31633x]
MEGVNSPKKTPKKKKRHSSLLKKACENGVDVSPVASIQEDPTFSLKGKRKRSSYPCPNQIKANKKRIRDADETELAPTPTVSDATSLVDLPSVSPAVQSSTVTTSSHTIAASPSRVRTQPCLSSATGNGVPHAEVADESSPLLVPEGDNQHKATNGKKIVWDQLDPLGLFDELEGPLNWPSGGILGGGG